MVKEVKVVAVPRCPFCFGPIDDDGHCIERPQLRCRDVQLNTTKKSNTPLIWMMIAIPVLVMIAAVAFTIYLQR
jgi:predicted nucleic acid-binding Zn ribbon protein